MSAFTHTASSASISLLVSTLPPSESATIILILFFSGELTPLLSVFATPVCDLFAKEMLFAYFSSKVAHYLLLYFLTVEQLV